MKKSNMVREEIDSSYYNNYPKDKFSQYVFEEINRIRANPSYYCGFLEDCKKNIKPNRYQEKLVYNRTGDNKCKVLLNRGEEAFDEAIDDLGEAGKLDKLVYSPEITIDPPKKYSDIRNQHYFQDKVDQLKQNGYNIKAFWKDVVNDKESCVTLLLVDDNGQQLTGRKRKILLDPDIKQIGISSNIDSYGRVMGKGEKEPFCCYMTFSKDRVTKDEKKNNLEAYNANNYPENSGNNYTDNFNNNYPKNSGNNFANNEPNFMGPEEDENEDSGDDYSN